MHIKTSDGLSVPNTFQKAGADDVICILAHGITVDRHEGGLFDRQAQALNEMGVSTLQIDFRGHGMSELPSQEMTISGEVLDLAAVLESVQQYEKVFILAASFACLSLGNLPKQLLEQVDRVCLWNPILSIERTFMKPELLWQKFNFGAEKIEAAIEAQASLLIDRRFEIGVALLKELSGGMPDPCFADFKRPICVVHGSKDDFVSYEIAQEFARTSSHVEFVSVPGSQHGFDRPEDKDCAVNATLEFFKL